MMVIHDARYLNKDNLDRSVRLTIERDKMVDKRKSHEGEKFTATTILIRDNDDKIIYKFCIDLADGETVSAPVIT